ncbi:hypothetical protein BS17DRAFT_772699 [Gyrodon lividus]|nr:hypothetical protein BS17DRAFT_772699 [Gyrodon lividus]
MVRITERPQFPSDQHHRTDLCYQPNKNWRLYHPWWYLTLTALAVKPSNFSSISMYNPQGNALDLFSEHLEQMHFAGFSESAPSAAPTGELTCAWITEHGICGSILSHDPKVACLHFRGVHGIRGGDKEVAICLWGGCRCAPMQRGSLIRHISAVHLRILQWTCPHCAHTFSRKDTNHQCLDP